MPNGGKTVSSIKALCLEKTLVPSRRAVVVWDNVLSMAQTEKQGPICDHLEQIIETELITAPSIVVTHTYRKEHPRRGSLEWGLFIV